MVSVFFSIGSNLGDKNENINKAIYLIQEKIGRVILTSKVYENPPLGFDSPSLFYNVCIQVSSELNPEDILIITQDIEILVGRVEKSNLEGYVSRVIDIDLILYDQLVYASENLVIPHERYRDRVFVLKPLSDIAPDWIDPITNKTIRELLFLCQDSSVLTPVV